MKKILFIVVLSLVSAKDNNIENIYNKLNHNISIGLFDDKTGPSLIGYSLNKQFNQNDELFIGFGTALLLHTVSLGFKHYHKTSKLSIYSSYSIKRLFLNNDYSGYGEVNNFTYSLSLEYSFSSPLKINLGCVGVIDDAENNYEIWGFPFLSFNFNL